MLAIKVLAAARKILQRANVDSPDLSARILLQYLMSTKNILVHNLDIPENKLKPYFNLIKRRINGEPLQYIVEMWEFMSLEFYNNDSVLIPRPETEILVESIIERCEGGYLLDVGTGSGCIIISLIKMLDNSLGYATEISLQALEVARKNADKHGVLDKIIFKQHDALTEKMDFGHCFDVVVSNPPYIPTHLIDSLQKEIREHEPHLALDGGIDGLLFYRAITPKVRLRRGGLLAFEVGIGQAQEVALIMESHNFKGVQIIRDLNSIERVVIGISPGNS